MIASMTSSAPAAGDGRPNRARTVVALVVGIVFALFFALVYVSAFRDPKAHELPFGVTGSSKLTTQVEKHVSLNLKHYADEAAARNAIDERKVYGALIVQPKTSTLLTAPAASNSIASFLEGQFILAARHVALSEISAEKKKARAKQKQAQERIDAAQEEGAATLTPTAAQSADQEVAQGQQAVGKAKKAPPPVQVEEVHRLPKEDPNGVVAPLTAIGLVFGGYITATILMSATGVAARRWRVALLLGWAVVLGLLVDVLIGPILGGVSGGHFLALWPVLAGIGFAVALATSGLQTGLGALGGTAIAVLVLVIVGGAASGESLAPSFLPGLWRTIGPYLPTYNGITLIRNTVYFDANAITQPLLVLGAYAALGALAIFIGWKRATRKPASPENEAGARATNGGGGSGRALAAVALGLTLVLPSIYIFSFVGANRDPKAHELPFGVTGSSKLTTQVEKHVSLNLKHYADEAAARNAIDERKVYGALIVQPKTSTLLTAPAASVSIASLLDGQFLSAAQRVADNEISAEKKRLKTKKRQAQQEAAAGAVNPQAVQDAEQGVAQAQQRVAKAKTAPPPVKVEEVHSLPNEDPTGVVSLLTALAVVIGGYVTATILMKVTGVTTKRWRVAWLLLWAAVVGLLVDVLVGPILGGVSGGHFLALWPILAGIAFAVGLATAGLQTILGTLGTLVVMIAVIQIGIPASGETLAPSFLPGFWSSVGPYLPPYNATNLVQNTIYFDGNGMTHSLIVLGAYAVLGALVMLIGWTRAARSPIAGESEAAAAAGAAAAG